MLFLSTHNLIILIKVLNVSIVRAILILYFLQTLYRFTRLKTDFLKCFWDMDTIEISLLRNMM
jgi:hypothetical protein